MTDITMIILYCIPIVACWLAFAYWRSENERVNIDPYVYGCGVFSAIVWPVTLLIYILFVLFRLPIVVFRWIRGIL